jgi:uncharacterized protein (TIGR00299 family) protein
VKTLYFDLIGGISGDMTVAALLDLGVSLAFLKRELKKIAVSGYSVGTSRVMRGHTEALKFDVKVYKPKNYSYAEITRLISKSRLAAGARERALKIYGVLKDAEVQAHGRAHDDIRFHQLGEIDSIIDIVATAICLEHLSAGRIFHSVIPLNKRWAPATARMLEGLRVTFTSALFENVTPTGLAILKALAEPMVYERSRVFSMGRCGHGAGAEVSCDAANVLRIAEMVPLETATTDEVVVLEANIDDMNPQVFEDVFEELLRAGALDVSVTPLIMKRSRPAFLLTVLSSCCDARRLAEVMLTSTTTIGVRSHRVERLKLARREGMVRWRGQKIRVKEVVLPRGGARLRPEFEDCRRAAHAVGRPVFEVIEEVLSKAGGSWRSQG